MNKQCDASIRIKGIEGLFCCALKKGHEKGNETSHIFEVVWWDYDNRILNK